MGKTKKHASMAQKKRNQARLNSGPLVLKDTMQTYGMVIRSLGDRRFHCMCCDGVERQCKIRGKLRGRLYLQIHGIVLISLREELEDAPRRDDIGGVKKYAKADILQRYQVEQVHELKRLGEFTDHDFAMEGDEQTVTRDEGGDIIWTKEDIEAV